MAATEPTRPDRALLLLDALLVVAAMGLARALHAELLPVLPLLKQPPPFREYALLVYLAVPCWLILVVVFGLHDLAGRAWTPGRLLIRLAEMHLAGLVLLAGVLFATQIVLNRSLVGLFLIASFVLLAAARLLLLQRLRYLHRTDRSRRQVLLVGEPGLVMSRFVRAAQAAPLPPRLVGRLSAAADPAPAAEGTAPESDPAAPALLGSPDALGEVLHSEAIDEVVFFPPYNRPATADAAVQACLELGKPAYFVLDWLRPDGPAWKLLSHHGQPCVMLHGAAARPERLGLKHALDFSLALIGLIVAAPLLLLVGLAALIGQGRPLLFIQQRIGLHGRRFRMYKFRTMHRDADASGPPPDSAAPVRPKRGRDPRITRLGRLLRRTSLDELPQLLNVLNGTMSLVGPRPLPAEEQQRISGWQRRRLAMRPGLTGLWQVSGRSDTDFETWMHLDLEYVDHWNLWLDVRILLRTVWIVLTGRGAR
jgi:exopolysaccharide biosynthesis polyprenyl glycosylphosphotransferase